jgi:hypothetical protein
MVAKVNVDTGQEMAAAFGSVRADVRLMNKDRAGRMSGAVPETFALWVASGLISDRIAGPAAHLRRALILNRQETPAAQRHPPRRRDIADPRPPRRQRPARELEESRRRQWRGQGGRCGRCPQTAPAIPTRFGLLVREDGVEGPRPGEGAPGPLDVGSVRRRLEKLRQGRMSSRPGTRS